MCGPHTPPFKVSVIITLQFYTQSFCFFLHPRSMSSGINKSVTLNNLKKTVKLPKAGYMYTEGRQTENQSEIHIMSKEILYAWR